MVTSGNFLVRELNKKIDNAEMQRIYTPLRRVNTRTYEKWAGLRIWIQIDRLGIWPWIQFLIQSRSDPTEKNSSGSGFIKITVTYWQKGEIFELYLQYE